MAASPMPLQPPTFGDNAQFFAPMSWLSEDTGQKREQLRAVLQSQDSMRADWKAKTVEFVQEITLIVQKQPSIDVDDAIDFLRRAENDYVRDREDITRIAEERLRNAAANNPGVLPLMNEALREFRVRFNQMAAVARDARWSLMAVRAEHQPSEGKGPVHGSGEPPEQGLGAAG